MANIPPAKANRKPLLIRKVLPVLLGKCVLGGGAAVEVTLGIAVTVGVAEGCGVLLGSGVVVGGRVIVGVTGMISFQPKPRVEVSSSPFQRISS